MKDCIPEGVLPFDPMGSLPVTDTEKLVEFVAVGSRLTVLVGGVVSISHEAETEPVPELPYVSWRPVALTVSVNDPSAVVRAARPVNW